MEQTKVISHRGGNATLPCKFHREFSSGTDNSPKTRIKWTKLTTDYLKEIDVFVAMGNHQKSYGSYHGRVFLQEASNRDASLIITDITLDDYGKYKCEIIEGLEDDTGVVTLDLQVMSGDTGLLLVVGLRDSEKGGRDLAGVVGLGDSHVGSGVVFPYFPRMGRYNLNFQEAQQTCQNEDAVIASFDQLYDAWRGGLDWCNAGWLSDGSVQYPITKPREPCGGKDTVPGVRNYGLRDKEKGRYDVFCFTSNYKGRFYYLIHPTKLTYDEAVQACLKDGSQIAKVGQMFAAWKLMGYDRCDGGWLADGSVRYPISRPRRRCSPDEAAVRFVGFPDKKHKLYGVYCFRTYN
ncbi:HPLN1 protein, partial [Polyodon spathula]|nr:HPLN1 protein [Polyodon spathula]